MLITDRFVMLNFPKTGSSFARSVLKELHKPKGLRKLATRITGGTNGLEERLMVPYRFRPARFNYPSQHGVYVQIPEKHRGKVIMSITRDPLERIVSAYEFRHWAKFQEKHLDSLRKEFPRFPDLTFEEYLDMLYRIDGPASLPADITHDIGPFTTQFIRFFATDPVRTIHDLRDGMDLAAERDKHFAPVRFLHQENLGHELTEFLMEMGYAPERLRFILDKPKVNTTQRTRSDYLTPKVVEHVLRAERFLYQLFPEYLPGRN